MKKAAYFGLVIILLAALSALRYSFSGEANWFHSLPAGSSTADSPGPGTHPEFTRDGGRTGRESMERAARTEESKRAVPPPITDSLLFAIDSEDDADSRGQALDAAADSVAAANLPASLDTLASNTSAAGGDLRQLLVRRWAEADPAAAAAWATQLPTGVVGREVLQQVAIAWANSDLSAAAQWIQGLPDNKDTQAAVLGFASEAARIDPIRALESAGALAPGPERDAVLAHAASQWAAADPDAASAWAMKVPDVGLRQRLLAVIAIGGADRNAPAAAELVANSLTPGTEQERVAVAVVQRWAQTSPQGAAAWVAQFPDTLARAAAEQSLHAVPLAPGESTASN